MPPYEVCSSSGEFIITCHKYIQLCDYKIIQFGFNEDKLYFQFEGVWGFFFLLLKKREIKKRKSLEFAPEDESSVTQTLIFKAFFTRSN